MKVTVVGISTLINVSYLLLKKRYISHGLHTWLFFELIAIIYFIKTYSKVES